ncbi:MAG TPA: serine hydrolase domain-containing protein [Steroidobacteraceae bacterium]|nr:serine hydrolase domain-containing protein [Steroidobacteraceae bacterium]
MSKCAVLLGAVSLISLTGIRASRGDTTASAVQAVASAPAIPAHPLNKDDLEAFFDGIIPLQLERSDVAGASVLVMRDGKTLLLKGYGHSDLKSKQPVDPTATIFRLASISKLFTWISAMQLVEQGKLDLDVDVGRYLDFPIKTSNGISAPITLRNLMTHTGGFEETIRDSGVTDNKHWLGLREYLIQNQPHRIYEPGKVAAYSNYGVGLGSYIVQRVSGEPFEQYVAEHIFAPLGMTHSTFLQPPPTELEKLFSQGYLSSTRKAPLGFERYNSVGAAGLSSSAADMGRFGQALLDGGELDGHRILQQESLQAMWTPQFQASEDLPAQGLGFQQSWRNDLRWIGHQGDLVAFHSLFCVEPRNKLLLFVSYNSTGAAGRNRDELLNNFSDRYFPQVQQQTFISVPREEMQQIEGFYQPTRRAESTQLKLLLLLAQFHAALDKDGVLHVAEFKDLRGHPTGWRPIGKDLWQEVDEQYKFLAIRSADGGIVRVAAYFPGVQLERVPWYEHDHLIFVMLGISSAIVCSVLVAVLLRLARGYLLRSSQPIPKTGTLPLSALQRSAAVYWVVLLAGLPFVIALVADDDALAPTSAWDKYFLIGDILFAIAVVLSLFTAIAAVRAWRRPATRRMSQIKSTLVGLACLFLSWFVVHWNVIGPIHRF